MEDSHTFVIADDHPLFRAALKQTLSTCCGTATVHEAPDVNALQDLVAQEASISLILLDLHIPGAHGFSALVYLTTHAPHIPVIMVSASDSNEVVARAIHHGAAGFLSKSSEMDDIERAVHTVLEGDIWIPEHCNIEEHDCSTAGHQTANLMSALTPQQFKVATMLAQGLLNKQIAYELNVTEATIKAHVTEIFRKLGVTSRTQAVLLISQMEVQPPAVQGL